MSEPRVLTKEERKALERAGREKARQLERGKRKATKEDKDERALLKKCTECYYYGVGGDARCFRQLVIEPLA